MRITRMYSRLKECELYAKESEIIAPCGGMDAAEKERILKMAVETIRAEEAKSGGIKAVKKEGLIHGGKKKIGILALAAVLLMGITVSAAEYLGLNERFLDFLGVSEDTGREELESVTMDMQAAGTPGAESQGITVCASQAVSDGEMVYIYFDLELPDGIFAESDSEKTRIMRFRENSYRIGQTEEESLGGMVIRKQEEPGRYYAIGELQADVSDGGEELTVTFENLGYIEADDDSTKWVELIPGQWTIRWPLPYKDEARYYHVAVTIPVEGEKVEFQEIRLSPFSLKLTGSSPDPDGALYDQISVDGILMKDGSCRDLFRVGYVEPEDGKTVLGGVFENMVDMDQVKGIRINGEDICF